MKEKVIAIFDIGKTNKKILLFNHELRLVSEKEEKFPLISDDNGFECDDIEMIEKWIRRTITELIHSDLYDLTAVNFTTYGATLAYLDANGRRLTPVYNYLKPIPDEIPAGLYKRYGGRDEFCRRTASPALGMLNSGLQMLWLKKTKPEISAKVKSILHFPQYISYGLTGRVFSEHTSIGCHTAMWDFDHSDYHPWIKDEGISLPQPVPVDTVCDIEIEGKKIRIGIGIHDSSASLAPYFAESQGKFLLVSTGTWCINMNPFNSETLTAYQLSKDCLCYLSITQQPVKSSRLFLGHFHEVSVKKLAEKFNVPADQFKRVRPDQALLDKLKEKKVFFGKEKGSRDLVEKPDLKEFRSYDEAYHQLMLELCDLTVESINLVIPEKDDVKNFFITGGFAKNALFNQMLSSAYPGKKIYTSEVDNATALGAALVILKKVDPEAKPILNLGLKGW